MPKLAKPLSDIQVKRAKPGAKLVKLFDGHGLYLEIQPSGAKFWRFRYNQANGKETTITFGPYPEVSLADARDKRTEARRQLLDGKDPIQERELTKRANLKTSEYTFRKIATEWHELKLKGWSPAYAQNVLHRLELDIFPNLGRFPVDEVTHRDLIDVFRKIESRGAHEIAKRNKAVCAQIFSYAIQTGAATRNPIADMKDVLQVVSPSNFPAISSDELPRFLESLRNNEACMQPLTRIGLKLLMLVFVRTSELIETPWSEIQEGCPDWTIPWCRMKLGKRRLNPIKKDHFVPLSRQAVTLLAELRALTGGGSYLFPNIRDRNRPMSNNAFLKAIERMGYKGDMSGHGFRALAMSTIKEKLGYRHEVVDRQLAHVQKDKIARAYDRAEFIDERKVMMQDWADYIDSL
ncbi:integrase arm-type DNA-binding domain-containing protein [Massilia forsythiae]|uniref:Integrase arm-type DNA-binding domain-containing protein n=1 Tax=Massilia forsythiae TaxID=2728020 RepID=A0A7Z2W0H4_9BURK|nr:integrase arm-type DNA-binding domain-containing protein [Massilia forsythiae]QJE02836.1 integrase arm-type DNA-binding domain-containing protein [Massilia forsythiae]